MKFMLTKNKACAIFRMSTKLTRNATLRYLLYLQYVKTALNTAYAC